MAGKPAGELTPQQALFCHYYAILRNGSQAARAANFANPGKYAWRLLNEPEFAHVQQKVHADSAELAESLKAQRKQLLDRAWQLAFFNPSSVMTADGKGIKNLAEVDPEDVACIAGVTVKEFDGGSSLTAKFHSPAPYLKLLFQCAGLTGSGANDSTGDTEEQIDAKLDKMYEKLRRPEDAGHATEGQPSGERCSEAS